jgi:CheY-like chemotaxis protein
LFAIPTDAIVTTVVADQLQLSSNPVPNSLFKWVVTSETNLEPLITLQEYWQVGTQPALPGESAIGIYVKSLGQSQGVWFLADELVGQTELLIQPLPDPFVSPQGLLGVSLQPDGTLIPIVETTALAEVLLNATRLPSTPTETAAPQPLSPVTDATPESMQGIRILVVDDAALMRRRLEASLVAYGYNVQTCVDGLDAWNWLQNHALPDLVITDIEMPNMDGFTLIDRCRQQGMTLPMMVISSRLAEEWTREAKRVGATDYLTKGFSTPDLIGKVKQLLASPQPQQ